MKRTLGTMFFAVLFSMFLLGSQVFAEVKEISVDLKHYINNASSVDIELQGDYLLNDEETIEAGSGYQIKTDGGSVVLTKGSTTLHSTGSSFTLSPVDYEKQSIKINNQRYLGNMTFQSDRRGSSNVVLPTNTLYFEDYLKGVVPREMSDSTGSTDAQGNSGLEALKAQAIIARTFAQARSHRTLVDTTSDQVYGGLLHAPNSIKAVNETIGEVLTYDGKLFETFYSASNGGIVQSNVNAWGGSSLPYLMKRTDDYDPKPEWSFEIKRNDSGSSVYKVFENLLKRHGGKDYSEGSVKIKDIVNITPIDFKTNERIIMQVDAAVEKSGQTSSVSFKAPVYELRIELLGLGISQMGSHLINEVKAGNEVITLKGTGLGHGVGLSQRGAIQRALNGHSDQSILAFYYPNALIEHNGDRYKPSDLSEAVPPSPGQEEKEEAISLAAFYAEVNPGNELKVRVSPSRSGNLDVLLKKDDKVIETLQERTWVSAGEKNYSYDASSLTGTHTVSVRAADSDGNVINEDRTVVFQDLSELITSMDISRQDREVEIKYETARNSNVSIKIWDENEKLVEELKPRSWDQAGENSLVWDAGELSGDFTFELRAADGRQTVYETETISIEELRKLEDMIELSSVEYRDGKIHASFASETGANLSIDLLDEEGQKIKELKPRTWDSAGSYEEAWEVDFHGVFYAELRAADGNEVIFKKERVEIPEPLKVVIEDLKLSDREVQVFYKTTKNANVSIEVYDEAGSRVDTVKERSWDQAGENSVTWNAGTRAGTYTFELRAADGKKVVYAEKDINIPSVELITKAAAELNGRDVTFTYETTKNANVSIEVYDEAGSRVDTMKERSWDQAGENSVTWNAGTRAGSYTFELRAADGERTAYEEKEVDIPSVELITKAAAELNGRDVTFTYETTKNANVSIEVYDEAGSRVDTMKERSWDQAGENSVTWNAGTRAGTYTFELRAADGERTAYEEKTVELPEPPLAFISQVITGSEEVEIHYTTINNANVSIALYDSRGNKVEDIKERTWDQAGSNKISWKINNLSGTYKIEMRTADGSEVLYLEEEVTF